MSYILDALKKSEQQRPPGPVPDLFTVQGPQPPAGRPPRAVVLLAALGGAVALGLGVWAWLGDRQPAPPPQPAVGRPQVAAAPTQEQVAAQSQAVDLPAAASPPPAASPALPRAPRVRPASQSRSSVALPPAGPVTPPVSKPVVTVAESAAVPAAPATPPATEPTSPARPAVPAANQPVAGEVPQQPGNAEATPVAPAPEAAPAEAAVEPAPEPVPVPPADGRIVSVDELPESLRELVGLIAITGHVWSEDPALRLLTVQDRIVRAGADAVPGVRLEEITPAGAVFVTQGWRVRVAGR